MSIWLLQSRWQLINFVKFCIYDFFVSVILGERRSLKSTQLHNPHHLKGFCFPIMKEFSKKSEFTEKKIL